MINLYNFEQLIEESKDHPQIEGFVCVGYGINFRVRGVEVPFSLTELLGVTERDIYCDTGDSSQGEPRMVNGFWGATKETLYYITEGRYDSILERLA